MNENQTKKTADLYKRDFSGKLELYCPRCGEELVPADVENFPRCPYCNEPLPADNRLEDFVIDPVVRNWAGKVQSIS